MRDAPWIEKAERYGCEYMYDFIWGTEYEKDEEEYDYEQDE